MGKWKKQRISLIKTCNVFFILLFILGAHSLYCTKKATTIRHKSILNKKKANKYCDNGRKYLQKGNLLNAEDELKKCVLMFPDHDEGNFLYSQVLYRKGNYKKALEFIKNAKAHRIDSKETNITTVNKNIQRFKEQIQSLKSTLLLIPVNCNNEKPGSWEIKEKIKEKERLINQLKGKLFGMSQFRTSVPYEYNYLHGNIYFKLKKYREAREQYENVISSNPTHFNANNNLITCCYILKQYHNASYYLKQAMGKGLEISSKLVQAVKEMSNNAKIKPGKKKFPPGVKRVVVKVGSGKDSFYENTYIVFDNKTNDCIIIDPGARDRRIEKFIADSNLNVLKILNTHGHFDHTGANHYYANLYQVKIVAHKKDLVFYKENNKKNIPHEFLSKKKNLLVGSLKVNILFTPGHSSGSVCFFINGNLFSGDTLFKESIGAVYGKTEDNKLKKIKKFVNIIKSELLNLNEKTMVFPGHGQATTIGHEKKYNPYLN